MSLEQHTSLQNALTFAPHIGFFSSIVPRDQIARGDEGNILVQRMNHYLSQARELLDKPRTGWTREKRKIPLEYQETVGAHVAKVSIAGYKIPDGLLQWHLSRGESPSIELWDICNDIRTRTRIVRKGFFHDFQEWGKNPDLTPGEATKVEQDRIEYDAMLEYARVFGDEYPLQLYLSMREVNLENMMLYHLDKMDAPVMALNYERDIEGCDVSEFFPYAFSKFSFPMMGEILQTLIDHKRDYPNDFFVQYDSLLFHGGNIDAWRREMDMRARKCEVELFYDRIKRYERRWGRGLEI